MMKKLISFIVCVSMLLSILVGAVMETSAEPADVWDGTVGEAFDGGNGSADDPYLISSGKTLAFLASSVNAGTTYKDVYFALTTDIDLKNEEWTPIGYYFGSNKDYIAFSGIFDGCGHTISNLNAVTIHDKEASKTGTGLFGIIIDGSVSNLGVESGVVSVSGKWGGGVTAYISGISIESKITNCYNKATVKIVGGTSQDSICGGITGFGGNQRVVVENCINYGDIMLVSGKSNSVLGGICGRAMGGTYLNSYNVGDITAGAATAGGLFGNIGNSGSNMADCATSGIVSGTGKIGYMFGEIAHNGSAEHTFGTLTAYTGGYATDSTANKATKYVGTVNSGITAPDSEVTIEAEISYPPMLATEMLAYQTSEVSNNKQNIRFIVSAYDLYGDSVGMEITATYQSDGKNVILRWDRSTDTVYGSVLAKKDGEVDTVEAGEFGANYLYTAILQDVPVNIGQIDFQVRTYIVINGEKTYSVFTSTCSMFVSDEA